MTNHYDSERVEIDVGGPISSVAFTADGRYMLVGGERDVGVWRMQLEEPRFEQETAMVTGLSVLCLAVSSDGRWIAAGTHRAGVLFVWDAETREEVFKELLDSFSVNAVDFSPDSTRLVSGAASTGIATIWDVHTRQQVQTLHHDSKHVISAKYSPEGDRIATAAAQGSVRVWDSTDGSLLIDIPVEVIPYHNTGLLWSDNHLFAVANRTIVRLDASTGSTASKWSVHATGGYSCIALPTHGGYIAYAVELAVRFLDTQTGTQLRQIDGVQRLRSLAISPENRFIVAGGNCFSSGYQSNLVIENLSRIIPQIPLSRIHRTFREPNIQIDDAVLDSWRHDQLQSAEASLTTTIAASKIPEHHALACRALMRTRLQEWSMALADADSALDCQPSALGYIAKGIAHAGNGEHHKAHRAFDIASERFHSSHMTFLLVIKAIVVFMVGEHADAIARMDDLIATVHHNSILYMIQAYMHFLVGTSHMQNDSYEKAMQSFKRARAQLRPHSSPTLFVISLMCGWKFDNLGVIIRQRLCDTLYSAGFMKDASESLLELIHTSEKEVYMDGALVDWVSHFTQRCLSSPESAIGDDDGGTPHAEPTPLLKEWVKATLVNRSWEDAFTIATNFIPPKLSISLAMCERLQATGRIMEAIECFHAMTNDLREEVYTSISMAEWISNFTQQCLSAPTSNSVAVPNTAQTVLLREWAKAKLSCDSWKDAILSVSNFTLSKVVIYEVMCERLEATDRMADAVECFQQMTSELGDEMNMHREHYEWALDFRRRYSQKPKCTEELLADTAMNAHKYTEAISFYTTALLLDPFCKEDVLVKRSKAYIATGTWQQALDDANHVIALDPFSPWGYEMKHAALHEAGNYDDAIDAFKTMLSNMERSPDPQVQKLGDRYIHPSNTVVTIRKLIQKTTHRLPRELINTSDGQMYNRTDMASAFESSTICKELISSTISRVDYVRIKREIRQYFRYVMLSHRWEDDEPLFQHMVNTSVYDLDRSPTHDKLQKFCKIVQEAGFIWAWSDTCCIDKSDHFVLQEALVVMFKWYEGSALTIVYLRGVHSSSQIGALMKSVWNTRAWTLQEYIAAKVVHFYTEDWSPYLNVRLSNHKESPEVILEMEEATGVSTEELMALRPGLSSIREKLRLASTRKTTLPEDAAYSLLGIFSAAGISAIYGEGEGALGRLLANVVTRSGDVGILAWTGESGPFNSCLPAYITVFNGPVTSHLPEPIPDVEMRAILSASHASPFDLDAALKLYGSLSTLPQPRFAESRMTLPCIAIRLPRLSTSQGGQVRVYRANTDAFGIVEIKTRHDLSRMGTLYLIHPWLESLLEHEDAQGGAFQDNAVLPPALDAGDDRISDEEMDAGEVATEHTNDEDTPHEETHQDEFYDALSEPDSSSHSALEAMTPMDDETRARRLVARLRRPFGALLLTLSAAGRRVVGYKRVAADTTIDVQFREDFPLADVLEGVRTFDVL